MGKWYALMDTAPQGTKVPTELFPVWLQIIVGIFILAIVIIVLKWFFGDIFGVLFSKKKTIKAILVAKRADNYVSQTMYASNSQTMVAGGLAEKGKEYFADFETDNGKTMTLLIPKRFYDVAIEGSNGNLTYKGKRFIEFKAVTEGTVLERSEIRETFVPLNKKF